jgi:hypothetical protein
MGILSWLGGPGGWIGDAVKNALTGPLVDGLVNYQKAKLAAGNTSERLAADLAQRELQVEVREAEVNSQTVIAEQGNWLTRSVRPLMAMPFIIFLWKVVVWDKVLALGTTDRLDPKMWGVFMAVVVAYMGGRSFELGASKIADSIKAIRK